MTRLEAAMTLCGLGLVVLAFGLVDPRLGMGVGGLLLIFAALDIRRAT